MRAIILLSIIVCSFGCQHPQEGYLGVVNLSVTGNDAALPYFEKGLLLLHSFEYEDACEEFLKAQQADSGMVMAYWGEAMTYNHSLWSEQNYEKARSALDRLSAKGNFSSVTDLEKDLVEAVGVLYRKDTPKVERDKTYAESMEALYQKYPGNHEIAAFYSLSLLGSVSNGRDEVIYGQGAIVAKSILEDNPKHPGALHYLIHSYDDPNHAQLALDAANAYSRVAPDASHALHMPSHIYVALGMWNEVVTSNEHSYQASLDRMKRKHLDNDARGYHSFHWLLYGYLQQGRLDEARRMVLEMEQYAKETPSKRARVHMALLKGTYLVETGLWESSIAEIPVDVSDLNVSLRSQYGFLEGMKSFTSGSKKQLGEMIAAMKKDYEFETVLSKEREGTFCMSANRGQASQTDIDQSRVMEMQLRGILAWMESDPNLTEQWLKKSVELEDSISYSYGPPTIQKPTHELYAEWLLDQGRAEEALRQFDLTLERAPRRVLALRGKQHAAAAMGNESMAGEIAAVLSEIGVGVKK